MNHIIQILPQRDKTGSLRTGKEKQLFFQNGKDIKPNRYEILDILVHREY
jgi:hypothetical protein